MDYKARDRLMGARCYLLIKYPFYGTMASQMEYFEDAGVKTMGVCVKSDGRVECYYNPAFVKRICPDDSLDSKKRLMAVVQHEVEHIVRLHCTRLGSRNPQKWNISCDMVVNGKKNEKQNRIPDLPDDCVYLPNDFDSNLTTEEVFDKIPSQEFQLTCPMCNGQGEVDKDQAQQQGGGGQGDQQQQDGDQDSQGDGSDKDGDKDGQPQQGKGSGKSGKVPCPTCGGQGHFGKGEIYGTSYDDHDVWNRSSMDPDQQRQLVKEMVKQAISSAHGDYPGHLKQAINQLDEPVINWKNEIRSFLGRECGSRRTTYARRNRRVPRFGVKGVSRHAQVSITIAVDTSGSIDDRTLKHFFSEVESASHKYKITLVQFDHTVQDIHRYRRGDWRKIEAKGRGGTSFVNLIEGMKAKKVVGKANIILTDGYAPWPDPQKFPIKWFIIHGGAKPPHGEWVELPNFGARGY